MKITINKKGILPCYLPYIRDYKTRVNVFYGGAGSGKSYFVMQKIILKALDSQRKVLIVRKVGATLKESVWSLTLELIHTGGLAPTVKQINKSDLTIEFLNGSVLLFKGLDDNA